MIAGSDVVITICQELQDTVTAMGARRPRRADRERHGRRRRGAPDADAGATLRERWGLPADAPVVLYTGTFEPYQGLDLLLEAAALLHRSHPAARVLIVGGEPAQVEAARKVRGRAGRGQRRLHRAAAGARDPGLRGRGSRAGLAAHPRDQHAAEDLLVPALGHADRGHRPADPHPGARARGGAPGAARGARHLPPPSAPCSTIRRPATPLAEAARRLSDERYSRAVYLRRTEEAVGRLAARAKRVPAPALAKERVEP